MFKNLHMGIKMGGVRVDVEVKTEDHIRKQLNDAGINTWEDFITASTSQRLYGNTKLTDLPILAAVYRFELNLVTASRHLGYAPSLRDDGELYYTSSAIRFRLKRMNVDNMFNTIEPLIEKGIITRKNIRHILEGKEKYARGERRLRQNAFFRYYARWYVMDGIRVIMAIVEEKKALVTHNHIVQIFASFIGVSTETIWYWIDMEVEDIMVKPTN